MAVVLSSWKYTIFIWRIGKFSHEIFNHITKLSRKSFVYIFNIKNSGFIISRQLTLEIECSIFRPKDFKLFHNSLNFPTFWVSLLSKYAFFFVRISFCSSFLTSLYLSSSTYKRDFSKIPHIYFFRNLIIKPIFRCTLYTFVFTECKTINNCHDLLNEVFISFVNVVN